MDQPDPAHSIRTLGQLQSLFGPVAESSSRKEVDFIHPKYRAMIEASPFAILATAVRTIPTAGAVLEALTDAAIDGAKYDADLPARQRATLY
jgi:predicted pyridoxine 5'-phosphate oxidase superfamily flavin-nucleotide-binding protein